MSITVTELTERLKAMNGQFVGGDLPKLVVEKPAMELLLAIKNRVKNFGRATDGTELRRYSTTPIYVTPDKFIRSGFNAQGKRNFEGNTIGDVLMPTARLKSNSRTKNPVKYTKYTLVKPDYTERKSMYLKDGYMELREIQGLRVDITNMAYSGKMLADYQMQRINNTYLLGMVTEESRDKYLGLTYGTRNMRGFGEFMQASKEEIQAYKDRTLFNITRLTVNLLTHGEQVDQSFDAIA